MRKTKIALIAIVAIALCVGGAIAFVFLTLQPDTWTVSVGAIVEAKLVHPDFTANYGINYPDWTQNTAWHNGEATSYIMFGPNNVGSDIYLTLSATGPYITASGTINAEITQYNVAASGEVVITETSLHNITNINTAPPYNIPTTFLTQTYPTATVNLLKITYTFTNTLPYGDYPTTITINLTDDQG